MIYFLKGFGKNLVIVYIIFVGGVWFLFRKKCVVSSKVFVVVKI